jgi:hypothetical protein
MVSQAEQTIQQPPDEHAELHADLVENGFGAVQERKRHESTAARHSTTLAGENAAARYRKLALCSPLCTDAEFRILCLIVEKADSTLANSFASVGWLQRNLGGQSGRGRREKASGRRGVRAVYKLVASLEAKGFLRRHRLGWQLRLPKNVLAPGAVEWDGPQNWSKRIPKGEYA